MFATKNSRGKGHCPDFEIVPVEPNKLGENNKVISRSTPDHKSNERVSSLVKMDSENSGAPHLQLSAL